MIATLIGVILTVILFGRNLNGLGKRITGLVEKASEREDEARKKHEQRQNEILFEVRGIANNVDQLEGQVKTLQVKQDDHARRIQRLEDRFK